MRILFSKLAKKLKNLWSDAGDTGSAVARGAALLFASRMSIKLVQFVRTMVLARLLAPNDFGLFGIAAVTIGFADTLFQSGLNSSIIREKGNVEKYLDSVWTVNIIRNTLLALVIFFCAPLAGAFFNNEAIIPLVRILSLSIFIVGFDNVGTWLFSKEMQFNKKFFFDLSIVISDMVFVLIAAFFLRSALALCLGAVANRVISVAFSYVFHPYRPKLTLDFSGALKLFKYGKWISLAGVVSFFVSQGDNVTVGKILTPSDLGYYQLAFGLATLPALEVARSLGNVLFPFFSKVQDDRELLRRSFIKLSRMIFALTIPMSFGILALAPDIVRNFYTATWLPMVPILAVLVWYGLVKSFEFVVSPLFLGVGKPKVSTTTVIIQFVVMFASIVPLANMYGTVGVALSVLFSGLASQVFLFFMLQKEIRIRLFDLVDIVGVSLLCGMFMTFMILWVKGIFPAHSVFVVFFYVAYGAIIYAACLSCLDRFFGRNFYESFLWFKRKI